MRLSRILGLCFLVFLVFVQAQVKCPRDDSLSYFTGRTQTSESGKLMKEYKCTSYGHTFWVIP
jgi:hypothetical protein